MHYPTLFAGARAPEQIEVIVQVPEGMSLDLSTVSAVNLSVYRRPEPRNPTRLCPTAMASQAVVPMGPLGGVPPQIWSTVIQSRGCGKIIVTHAYVDGDDVDIPGALVIVPTLSLTPSGVLRCAPIDILVASIVC